MGQSKSKHVYAFRPLPWPEALAALRLIDQICGIASTYATTQLDTHATVVVAKVNELQRLPYLWDAFEDDIERLRGTQMVRLATELHHLLDKLEGYKYDLDVLADKDLTFKSKRQAAEKVVVILRDVEEAHRAFHYAFELALYGSIRREESEALELRNHEGTARGCGQVLKSPTTAAGRDGGGRGGFATSGGGATLASSGGGTAIGGLRGHIRMEASPLGSPPPPPPPPPPAPEDSWLQDVRSPSLTPRRTASQEPVAAVRYQPPDAGEITPASPRQPLPALVPAAMPRPASPSPSPRRPMTADASTMARRKQPAVSSSPRQEPRPRPRSTTRLPSSRSHSGRRRDDSERRGRDGLAAADQQYVVMYMPQGPDGDGPRAILVPAGALQPAPSSPGPAMAATTVTGGVSPFATNVQAAYTAMPPALAPQAPALGGGHYLTASSSAMVPPQQQPQLRLQQQAVNYQPYQPPPSRPTTGTMAMPPLSSPSPPPPPSPPLLSYRSPAATSRHPYGSTTAPKSYLTHTYSGTSAASSYTLPYMSSTHAPQPASYRYFTPLSGAAALGPAVPSPNTAPASVQGPPSSPAYDMHGTYGTGLYKSRGSTLSPAMSMTASGTPDLNAYFDRPALSGAGSSGGWLSPLAAPLAAPAGAVSTVVPGAAPGSVLMLQPVSAHTTATGAVVLQPQSSPTQPPMLVVAAAPQQPGAAAAAPLPGGGGGTRDGVHGGSPGKVRFAGRHGGGSGCLGVYDVGDDVEGDGDEDGCDGGVDEYTRGSGGTDHSHNTYTYGPQGRGRHVVPSHLTPFGGDSGRDHAYDDLPLDAYDSYGVERLPGRRYSDGSGAGRRRDRSGGNARELVHHFRGRSWAHDELDGADPPAAALQQRRQSSYAAPPPPLRMAMPAHEAEMESIPVSLAAPAAAAVSQRRRSPPRSGSGRDATPLLPYERLAALAGLDLDIPGNGAAAATSPPPPSRASPIQLMPGEASLRRAELLSEALEGGDWTAAVELAGLVRGGWWGDSRDDAVARGLLLQAALRGGLAEAHAALGHMAERGEGLPGGQPDLTAAAQHYSAAAAGGHRDATTALAYMREHGLGLEQDEPRAAQLYAAAAQRNCPTAANNLAKMILDGRGATAAALAAAAAAKGDELTAGAGASLETLAKALFKRAARGGSASAWYNLGVCHLQQLKQKGPAGGGGGATAAVAMREDFESEAFRCFTQAAKRGHTRAALRAGYLHLQRSAAAAAVEAFCAAALNAAAARGPSGPAAATATAATAGDKPAAAPSGGGTAAAAAVEAEALWCLSQLAERQAAVLEVRTGKAAPAAAVPATASRSPGLEGRGDDVSISGAGAAAGPMEQRLSIRSHHGGDDDGSSGGGADDEDAVEGEWRSRDRSGNGGDGGGSGGSPRMEAQDDASSARTGGTESRAVGRLLAALTGSSNLQDPDGIAAAAAAATNGLDDPVAAAAAVRFAKEICRLDFSCCHQLTGQLPFTEPPQLADGSRGGHSATTAAGGVATAAVVPIRGLRRLRHQAREILAEDAAPGASTVTPGSLSAASSVEGGGTAATTTAAALARLELGLQQPAERARRARCAAAELMAAAAALGHAAAQHWLAGWRWSMGHHSAAVTLWEAAGRRGHGASLMVLGQMAESGQLPAPGGDAAAQTTHAATTGGAGGGADLATAARYYLRAQEAGAPRAVEAMRRVQKLLQRHVVLQGKLQAVAAGAGGAAAASTATTTLAARASLGRRP